MKLFSRKLSNERGDTLIEVSITIVILGVVSAGVLATMNNNLLRIMDSTQRTAVTVQGNSQVEMLNFLRNEDSKMWQQVVARAKAVTSDSIVSGNACQMSNNSFWLQANASNIDHPVAVYTLSNMSGYSLDGKRINPSDVAGLWHGYDSSKRDWSFDAGGDINLSDVQPGMGMWIDAKYVKGAEDAAGKGDYIEASVKSCWTPLGAASSERAQIQSVVRIQTKE